MTSPREEIVYAVVPHWFLVMLAIPWPVCLLRNRLRHHYRRKHGLCLGCGYDLRASTERCPECGVPIPADLVRRSLGPDAAC